MRGLPTIADPDLLVGPETFSDAGVYRVADGVAIVQTVDFFSPIVDDPFVFGQIAAANALSDVYAAGARPRTVLNIVAFPDDELDLSILNDILRGGADRIHAAGAVVVGGHSIREKSIIYGLAVTGTADPKRFLTNRGARAGDALVLTKPLGTGVIATANKAGRCPQAALDAACASMVTLNDAAAHAAIDLGASCATDVSGFSLVGHAAEMSEASGVGLEFDLEALPIIAGAESLATPENRSRASKTNREHTATFVRTDAADDDPRVELAFDPQTSGGLLIAINPDRADELVSRCVAGGLGDTSIVGRVVESAKATSIILR